MAWVGQTQKLLLSLCRAMRPFGRRRAPLRVPNTERLREREFTNFDLFSTAQTHLEDPLEKGSFSAQQMISEVEAWGSALVGRG